MVKITKDVIAQLLYKQGFANTQVGQNLYSNLIPLSEEPVDGKTIKDMLIHCRRTIAPDLDVPRALLELDIM